MSFAAPAFLLGLLLVPLAVAAYLRHERHRRAAAAAFAAPGVLASVAPRRPGWRRHAPPALYALALTALVVALAKPQTTIAVPVESAAIMLVTDYSGSMEATDVAPSRLQAARAAVYRFLDGVPGRMGVGLVAFNQSARLLQTPTTDRQAVRDAVASLRPSGGTATGEALAAGLGALERRRGPDGRRAPGAIVLLSDGKSTRGRAPEVLARRARRLRIPVHTVALGTAAGTIRVPDPNGQPRTRSVPPDPAAMRRVAEITRGRAYTADDAEALSAVYEQLGSRVGRRDEEREITAGFAGGALALLAAGALMSLHWFRRLP
jgi:Ca-activated chloride channel family protein